MAVSCSLIFGAITCVTGLLGLVIGAAATRFFRRKTERADPLVCAISMLGSAIFICLIFVVAKNSIVGAYVSLSLLFTLTETASPPPPSHRVIRESRCLTSGAERWKWQFCEQPSRWRPCKSSLRWGWCLNKVVRGHQEWHQFFSGPWGSEPLCVMSGVSRKSALAWPWLAAAVSCS